jgi:hypothetical protein
MRCILHKLTPLRLLTSFAAGLSLCHMTLAATVEQQTPLHIIVFPLDGTIKRAVTRSERGRTTRSDDARECRDGFLGITFWEFLGTRLGDAVTSPVPRRPQIVAARSAPA